MIAQISNGTIYTIGHSNSQAIDFINLLKVNNIKLLVDVRSHPYSQHNPHFNKDSISKLLLENEIEYFFLGNYLGGRPKDPSCYKNHEIPKSKVNYLEVVDYEEVAKRDWYKDGIRLLLTKANGNRTAIMCSEDDPNRCHRHHLITHTLTEMGITVKHIRKSGTVEDIAPKLKKEKLQQQQQLRFSEIEERSEGRIAEKTYPDEGSTNKNRRKIFTIGFTKKSAKKFFGLLRENRIERILDIRLNPQGQLAGFAKKDDLPYFLTNLVNCEYLHLLSLAPTEEILSDYKENKNWGEYVKKFEALMDKRDIPTSLDSFLFEEKICCLLCSEATPEKCHRRLVAERLAKKWTDLEIVHLF
jgi:uncharacterized protein (DUF488 family)